jgi:hypothetical protein
MMLVQVTNITSTLSGLLDIAVGAAASEQIIIPDLLIATRSLQPVTFMVPVHVAAGSRIAARCQNGGALGQTLGVSIELFTAGWLRLPSPGRVTAYGVNTADSGATNIDAGAVANTKGSYAQLSAAVNRTRAVILAIGDQDDQIRNAAEWLVDLAVGAAASEQVVLPNLRLACNSTSDMILPLVLGPFPVEIPEGSRLSARAQCSTATAGDRVFDLAVYGIG